MDLTAFIEYLTLKEAVVDFYQDFSGHWICTERISLSDKLPDEIITIRKEYGDKAALHDYGLSRAHKTARFYGGVLLEYSEHNDRDNEDDTDNLLDNS